MSDDLLDEHAKILGLPEKPQPKKRGRPRKSQIVPKRMTVIQGLDFMNFTSVLLNIHATVDGGRVSLLLYVSRPAESP